MVWDSKWVGFADASMHKDEHRGFRKFAEIDDLPLHCSTVTSLRDSELPLIKREIIITLKVGLGKYIHGGTPQCQRFLETLEHVKRGASVEGSHLRGGIPHIWEGTTGTLTWPSICWC